MNREGIRLIEALSQRGQEENPISLLKEQPFSGSDPGYDVRRFRLVYINTHPPLNGIIQNQPEMTE